MDRDLSIDQLLEKYPYLNYLALKMIYLTKREYDQYNEDEKINYGFAKYISKSLLKDLFLKDDFYKIVLKLFANEIEELSIAYISGGELFGKFELSKADILKCAEKYLELDDNLEIKQKWEFLHDKISYRKFYEQNKDKNFSINIEGKDYTFKIKDFLDFLSLDTIDFLNICLSKDIPNIKGVPKAYFFYALRECLNKKIIDNNYFPKEFLTHYNDLINYSLYDFQTINTFLKTDDPNIEKININEQLHDYILKDMPTEFNLLEKVIYIYIMLCKTLTYDEEFYVMHQYGEVTKKHEDIKHLMAINQENNQVVCYEFNAIFGKFLQELGINFVTKQAFLEKFGGGHAYLDFRVNKYFIHADSVTGILKGDLVFAKFNQPLKGLSSFNRNLETRKEFNEILEKVYKYINERKENVKPKTETFASLVASYRKCSEIKEISFAERLDILLKKTEDLPEVGLDKLAYLLNIAKILFTIEELDNVIDIKIMSNKETSDEKLARISIIITVNEKGIKNNYQDNLYYLYNPGEDVRSISREEIFSKLSNKVLEYMDNGAIPGISVGGR